MPVRTHMTPLIAKACEPAETPRYQEVAILAKKISTRAATKLSYVVIVLHLTTIVEH